MSVAAQPALAPATAAAAMTGAAAAAAAACRRSLEHVVLRWHHVSVVQAPQEEQVPLASAAAAIRVLPAVGGRGVGGRGGNSDGGRSVGGLRSASSEDDAEPPPVQEGDAEPPRVPITDAEWEKLNATQLRYFATWKPIATGGETQFNRARTLMTELSNVRGKHVEAANVAIAAIHGKHHPVVFRSALSFYSIRSASGAPDAAAGAPPPAHPPVRGAYSHVRFWKVRGGEHAGMYGMSRRVGRLDGDRFETVSLHLPVLVAGRVNFESDYCTRSNPSSSAMLRVSSQECLSTRARTYKRVAVVPSFVGCRNVHL